MKKKLLITLGCSYTEGVGCYDPNLLPEGFKKGDNVDEWHEKHYGEIIERWHANAWPVRLAEKLKYDKVINLGLGGSSTSGQLKIFMQHFEKELFKDYDVLLYWYLTEPSRISFYSGGAVKNMLTGLRDDSEIERGYVKMIEDEKLDPFLEQLFYVQCMNQICGNKGWKFLTSHSDTIWIPYIKEFAGEEDYWLHLGAGWWEIDNNFSLVCGHPNEVGYDIIATRMYNKIKTAHPELLGSSESEPVMVYSGDSKISEFNAIKVAL